MFDNVIESLTHAKTNPGFGCVLAHAMGLGKTLQVVSFTDVFLRSTGHLHTLIIVPVNTIQTWKGEFRNWLPERPAPTGFAPNSPDEGMRSYLFKLRFSKLFWEEIPGIWYTVSHKTKIKNSPNGELTISYWYLRPESPETK